MDVPDRIERTLELAHPVAAVWAALTTADGLAAWFGDEASIDLRAGGRLWMRWATGEVAEARVERVEEPSIFAFTWTPEGLPAGGAHRTRVEFTLVAVGDGTRLTVVETGFAPLPDDVRRSAHDAHTEGWGRELGELVAHLDAA